MARQLALQIMTSSYNFSDPRFTLNQISILTILIQQFLALLPSLSINFLAYILSSTQLYITGRTLDMQYCKTTRLKALSFHLQGLEAKQPFIAFGSNVRISANIDIGKAPGEVPPQLKHTQENSFMESEYTDVHAVCAAKLHACAHVYR